MSGEAILDYTKAEMERVAEAMSSIVAFMEPDADGGRPEYQGKFQADIIEQSYARLRDGMRGSIWIWLPARGTSAVISRTSTSVHTT